METTQQKALRMACDTFLAEYEGTPDLATLDQLIATATPWGPLEDEPLPIVQQFIHNQYRVNLRELAEALEHPKQLLREAVADLQGCDTLGKSGEKTIRKIQTYLGD